MKRPDKQLLPAYMRILFSFFGLGYAPKAPGTVGTIGALPLLIALLYFRPPLLLVALLLVVATVFSCLGAHKIQQITKDKDPSWIVLDEVLGLLSVYPFIAGLPGTIIKISLWSFLFFRFFDIIKIWPASYFDKKMQHGAGVILDDVISGLYVGPCILTAHHFWPNLF